MYVPKSRFVFSGVDLFNIHNKLEVMIGSKNKVEARAYLGR